MIISALITISLMSHFIGKTIPEDHAIYPATMLVVETSIDDKGTETIKDDSGKIILVDSNGLEWIYEEYPEDYFPGDYVSLIMDDNGTPNYIYDDTILDMRATGFIGEIK